MEPVVSMDFRDAWWPAGVVLISVGVERPNIYTQSVIGSVCSHPPMIVISPRPIRYSYDLLQENGQFVVNFPADDMVKEMEFCGSASGREVNKWEKCGFTPVKGAVIDVPYIAECPVSMECVVRQEVKFEQANGKPGSHIMLVAEIVHVHCHEKYVIDGRLEWDLVDTIFRARPRTWRALGPVIGYDARFPEPIDPALAAEVIDERTASLASLLSVNRNKPAIK